MVLRASDYRGQRCGKDTIQAQKGVNTKVYSLLSPYPVWFLCYIAKYIPGVIPVKVGTELEMRGINFLSYDFAKPQ